MATASKSGDPYDFYKWVGLYITRWALIEETLFLVCSDTLGVDERRSAVVFYRTPSLSSRIALVDELMTVRFPPPLRVSGGHRDKRYKAWARLSQRLTRLLGLRNAVAHHPVVWRVTGDRMTLQTHGDGSQTVVADTSERHSRFELYKSRHKRLRERDEDDERITVEDLEKSLDDVERVYRALVSFHASLTPP